jgi:hypothetical protein
MRTIVVLLACSLLFAACGVPPTRPVINATPPARAVQFTRVSQGAPLGDHPTEAFYSVVTGANAWDDVRSKAPQALAQAGEKDAKAGKVIYLAAFSGVKPSSGYSLEAQKITCQGDQCTLFFVENKPGAQTVVEPAMTLPYLLVSVPANQFTSGAKVTFIFKDLQEGSVYSQEVTIP